VLWPGSHRQASIQFGQFTSQPSQAVSNGLPERPVHRSSDTFPKPVTLADAGYGNSRSTSAAKVRNDQLRKHILPYAAQHPYSVFIQES